jgi:hypothetical protein
MSVTKRADFAPLKLAPSPPRYPGGGADRRRLSAGAADLVAVQDRCGILERGRSYD